MENPKKPRNGLLKRREFIKRSGLSGIGFAGAGNLLPFNIYGQNALLTHTAKVGRHKGRTCIFIDGKPIPGIAYLGPVSQRSDPAKSVSEALAAGIKILFVPVQGDWQGKGIWNFDTAIEKLQDAMEMSPDAWLVMRIILDAPAWWVEANPSQCARNYDSDGPERFASTGSEQWISESSEFLVSTAKALEAAGGDRIIGYHLLCSHGGEWIYTGAGAGRIGDYSEPGLNYYRKWLKRKYGDEKWIASANIPTEDERKRSLPELLRDPALDARVTDYDLSFSDMFADNLIAWCRAVKLATGGSRLVGIFYGYMWQMGLANAIVTNGHIALRSVIDCPEIDFIVSFPSYDTREPGSAAQVLLPVESLQAAGKLVFSECDNRTHLGGNRPGNARQPDNRFYMQRDQRDPVNGPQLWSGMWNLLTLESEQIAVDVLRREFAHHLIRGCSYWWFDMDGGWYSSPAILKDFEKENEIAKQAMDWDMTSISQVACIISYTSPAFHSFARMHDVDIQHALVDLNADMSTREMYKAGAPIDWWMMEDLARPDMLQYKAIYFHNATIIDQNQKKALENLKKDGRTLIFTGYPGLINGGKLDAAAASELTGIKLKLVKGKRSIARFPVSNYDLPCTSEAISQIVFGSGLIVSPRLVIDDPDATVIASWPDGQPAAAVKKLNGWTSYYFPVPPNNSWMFRGIFREAGCHIYTHNTCHDVVYANKSLLAIHSNTYGQPVKLPKPAKVTDLFTGRVVVEKGDTINLGVSWKWITGTRLFRVEYDLKD